MQAELLQIAANAVTAKLIGASRDTKLLVSQMLSYEVEGAERNEQFRAGNWDGRSSFFVWIGVEKGLCREVGAEV